MPRLHEHGHTTTVMDLPVDDGTATFEDYADAVLAVYPDDPEVILVGHSLGGMVIPLVAAERPAKAMVFLCAVIPNLNGQPWEGTGPMGIDDYGAVKQDDGSLVFETLEAATAVFYPDCSAAEAAWAFEHLRPFNNASLWDRAYPLTSWPTSRPVAMTCEDDVAIFAEYQRTACRDRLGIEAVGLPGGHSPFLAQPAALAEALRSLV